VTWPRAHTTIPREEDVVAEEEVEEEEEEEESLFKADTVLVQHFASAPIKQSKTTQ
jgi:hypothetical protein